MPNGSVHTRINLSSLCFANIAGYLYHPNNTTLVDLIAFTLGGLIGTFLITPDLDLTGKVDAKKHWGALRVIWIPFSRMSTHRGINHTYIVGPLLRLLYLSLFVGPLVLLLHFTQPHLMVPLNHHLLLMVFIGYVFTQWLHLIADGIAPWHYKKRKEYT